MISLTFLPALFYLSIKQQEKPLQTAVRFFLPSDNKDNSSGLHPFSKYGFLKSIERKKVVSINLGFEYILDEDYLSNAKFKFIQDEIARLSFINDTSVVLRIDFDSTSDYGEFVWAINEAKTFDLKRYALIDDCLYLLANNRPTTEDKPARMINL
jgi:hypothetical protein